MLGFNHATIIHSVKNVQEKIDVYDVHFINAINNWALVFEQELPDDVRTMWSVQDRIIGILESTLTSKSSAISILESLLEKYREGVVK